MAEYIEKGQVIEWFRPYGHTDKGIPYFGLVTDIHEMKAADVTPVKHGRWIEKEKYTFGTMYDCSICDTRILDNGHSWNYCPNCGAKMDGRLVALEELSEAQKEICNFLRGKGDPDHLTEEIADAQIMLEQVQMLCGIDDGAVQEQMDSKIERLLGRIKEARNG